MALLPLLLSFVVIVALYAVFVKLAARVYHRSTLSWRAAFGFGTVVAPAAVFVTATRGSLPVAITLPVGLAAIVGVGAWWLSSRATNPSGAPIGFKGAAALSGVAICLAIATGVMLAIVLPLVASR
jgi:hypothetical protein